MILAFRKVCFIDNFFAFLKYYVVCYGLEDMATKIIRQFYLVLAPVENLDSPRLGTLAVEFYTPKFWILVLPDS